VLVVAAVALVVWRRDWWVSGLALGLILATTPKPQLVPVLIWMLVYRPRSLVGALAAAGAATLLTVAVLGPSPYFAWLEVLRAPAYFNSSMAGNLTPDAVMPWIALPIKAWSVLAFLYALRRSETNGLVAALAVGLLVAPYTIDYAAMTLLLALRPVLTASRRRGMALAVAGPLAAFVVLPLYALAWLATGAFTQFGESRSGSHT
jgi:hypothetical protein